MKKNILLNFILLLFCSTSLMAQSHTVKGVVIDADNGDPLIGATILVIGTDQGTSTDVDGKFTLALQDKNATLQISYTGYKVTDIPVDGKKNMTISVAESIADLEEVVVVGYGVQKKSVVTGAISKVKSEDLEDLPVTRLEQSLQGRTSGVRVTTDSGQPGAAAVVRIRGTTTIGNSNPLYVVDGVPIAGGIDFLNQSDIASIEVLKDAASASVYGARAANGVILVTTHKGKEGKMSVNYSGYYGVQNAWRKLALLNGREYGVLMNEASVAGGGPILFDDPESLGEGTDWQDATIANDVPIQNHEISLTAGNEKSTYFASFGYFDQSGIVGEDKSKFQRFTARFSSTHKITSKIKFGNTVAYSRISARGVPTNTEFGSPLGRAINIDPLTPVYETDPDVLNSSVFTNFPVVSDENGVFGISENVTTEVLNPLAGIEVINSRAWSDKVVANVYGEVEFIEGLKFRSSIGADLAFWGDENYIPLYYLNASNRIDLNRYARNQNRGLYWIFENTLSYTKTIGDHDFSILGGVVAEKNAGEGIGGSISGIPVNTLEEASLGFPTSPESQTYFGFEYLNTLASYLGRVNYNYAQKYLFSATFRYDGSSKFGSNNKFGFFPALSAGWVVSEESFFQNNPVVKFLKIRGSWGVNGNNQIDDNLFVSTVGGFRNYTFGLDDNLTNGTSPNAIANPDLRWEETTQTNIGIDARLFKGVSLTLDWFKKKTSDMLLGIAVPGYVGNNGPVGNIATMENTGYEIELGYDKAFGEVVVGLTGNLSYVENEVTFLGEDKEFIVGQVFSPQRLEISRISPGLPVGYFYGYRTDGLFQNQGEVDAYINNEGELLQPDAAPGDIRFVDFNNDGIIDADDRTFIGDPTPNWTYGVNLTIDYKGFDLLIFGQGVAGNEIYKATRRFDLQMANLTADALGRWTGEGTSNSYPRLVNNDPNRNFSRSSDFYVENGAFFRIKTLQLGYTLPKDISEKAGMSKARIYVSGNNLLTFTEYSGFDPEIGGASFGVDRGIYPQPRFYLVGLNVTF